MGFRDDTCAFDSTHSVSKLEFSFGVSDQQVDGISEGGCVWYVGDGDSDVVSRVCLLRTSREDVEPGLLRLGVAAIG